MNSVDNIFKVTKWLMLIAGTWQLQLNDVSETKRNIYKVYSVAIWLVYHTCHVSFIIELSQLWGVDNEKAVECFSILIIVFLLGTKMIMCRSNKMTTFLENATARFNTNVQTGHEEEKNIYFVHSRYANRLNVFLTIWSFYNGVSLTIIYPVLHYMDFRRNNDIKWSNNYEKPLDVLYWYPFDPQTHYWIVILYQVFTIFFSIFYNTCIVSLYNSTMLQISAEIKVLQYNFKNFSKIGFTGEQASEKQAYNNFKKCIKDHQLLIENTDQLNKALKYILLIEYGVISLMMASILVQILSGKKLIYNTASCGVLVAQLLTLSWNANEIRLQSLELVTAIYESNWYNQSKITKQLVLITMLRTKKPLHLDIGPFGVLNIDAAISRLKLAYSYISIMS